jgi:hypothetical protein
VGKQAGRSESFRHFSSCHQWRISRARFQHEMLAMVLFQTLDKPAAAWWFVRTARFEAIRLIAAILEFYHAKVSLLCEAARVARFTAGAAAHPVSFVSAPVRHDRGGSGTKL